MWDAVKRDFAAALGDRLYPALLANEQYRKLLESAGIAPPFPAGIDDLTDKQRRALKETAVVRASLLAAELTSLNAVDASTAKVVMLEGPLNLYRLWDQSRGNELRFFWFREDLLRKSFQEGAGSKPKRLEWLRDRLAVAYNWSACDRIAKMDLKPREVIPAVEADGLPKRRVHIEPTDRKVSLPNDQAHYWKNYRHYQEPMAGGEKQLFLFLLPEERVMNYW